LIAEEEGSGAEVPPAPRHPALPWIATWAAVLAAVGLLGARVLRLYRPYLLVDDAFISFRYASHLAHGEGLVYNVGERVEGYSNFLWTVLIAGGLRLGGNAIGVAIGIDAVAQLGTILLLALWGRAVFAGQSSDGPEPAVSWGLLAMVPPLLFAADGAQARYVLSGMETPLFVMLVLAGVVLLLVAERPVLAGIAMALAAATRFEGVLDTGLLILAAAWLRRPGAEGTDGGGGAESAAWWRLSREQVRRALRVAVPFLALWLPYFLLRWRYYGYPLPNTYYAKAGGFEWSRLVQGWVLLEQVVGWWAVLPLVVLGVCALPLGGRRGLGLCWAMVVATVVSFVFFGGDFLEFFGPRFLMPGFPMLLLLAAAGLGVVAHGLAALIGRRQGALPRSIAPVAAGVMAVALAVLLGNSLLRSWPALSANLPLLEVEMESWERVGRWLAAETPPESVIAVGAAGVAPYYSGRTAIDMYGLADVHIAHRPPLPVGYKHVAHEHFDPRYVLDRRPDYLLSPYDREGVLRFGGLARAVRRVRACYRPLLLAWQGSEPPPDGVWLLPSRTLDPALWDRGYRTALLELRRGRGVARCEAISAEGLPGPRQAPAPPPVQ
jgi:arabinofuranosyltransferase